MDPHDTHRVELASVDISPNGENVVFGLVGAEHGTLRMEMPGWTVHQLMRVLPRVDAALARAGGELIAHPAVQWSAQGTGVDGSVALCVRSDQRVESAFLFSQADAAALHAALGAALSVSADRSAA